MIVEKFSCAHFTLTKKILKGERRTLCHEGPVGLEGSKWCCDKCVLPTPNVHTRQWPELLTTKANGDGWLRILTRHMTWRIRGAGMEVTQDQRWDSWQWACRPVVEGLGLGRAEVTPKEVPTHGPASVAKQQLCCRFHIPGLWGQRCYNCILCGNEWTEHTPWTQHNPKYRLRHYWLFSQFIIYFVVFQESVAVIFHLTIIYTVYILTLTLSKPIAQSLSILRV